MTIVTCGILPQGIMIAGDSRGVSLSPEGAIDKYFDDIRKVYFMSPYIIGVAGDSLFAGLILSTVDSVLKKISEKYNIAFKERTKVILELLSQYYNQLSCLTNEKPSVSFLVASMNEEYANAGHNDSHLSALKNKIHKIKGGVEDLVSLFEDEDTIAEYCCLMSVRFPECVVEHKKTYGFLSIGSGEVYNKIVSDYDAFIHSSDEDILKKIPKNIEGNKGVRLIDDLASSDIGELWASICFRIGAYFIKNNDMTFNEYLHGFTIDNETNVTAKWIEGTRLTKTKLYFRSKGADIDDLNFKFPKSVYEYILDVFNEVNDGAQNNNDRFDINTHIKMYFAHNNFWIMNPTDNKVYMIKSLTDFIDKKLHLIL